MQQPSAQGIASLYMGNPQPLQQQIQKDQQAKPGLPPDLQKMLALQIVTNEKDAAAAQTAMQQLKQMSGPTGQMPTVMQTLEQQAQQKMQAQQQPPMGGMGMPQGQAPQGQGVDQLPADFSMAGGGLVSFSGEERSDVPYETAYDRMNRKNREADTGSSDEPMDPQVKADREQLKRIWAAIKGHSEDAGRAIADVATAVPRGLVGAYDTAVVRPMRAAGVNAAYLSPKLTPEGANPESMTPFSDVKRAREAAAPAGPIATSQGPGDQFRPRRPPEAESTVAPAPINDLAALVRQKQQAAAPRPPVPPATPAQATPPAESEAMGILKQQMMAKPEDREAAEIAKYKAAVPAPDTSQHDRLIAELENRKQALNPKQGFEGLMEALSDVSRASQDPRTRGRGSFASGAAGALLGADRAKENQLQQFELSKQAIDVSQKKLEAVRAYAEKTYGVGKAAFDQVYKDRHDAAKEVVKDEAAAARLAKEETLKLLEMKNAKEIAAGHDATSLAAAKLSQENRGDRLSLDTLKAQIAAIDKDLAPLRKIPSTENKAKAAQLEAQKAALMKQLNATILGAPGVESSGGTTRMRFDAQGNPIK